MNAAQIRKHMRQQRRALSEPDRLHFSQRLTNHFSKTTLFRNARHIACYMAADGEMDLTPLMQRAWHMGKTVYLPVLNAPHKQSLFFAPYEEGDALDLNRYRIPEPAVHARERVAARKLDLVLTPLVAFDGQGNRMGMGAGYYDRTFAFLSRRQHWIRPRLIGVAYSYQQVEQLHVQPWDVPLHGVVTEAGFSSFI
jgi:5-formyltetrahydrofolate cyclo-ligase